MIHERETRILAHGRLRRSAAGRALLLSSPLLQRVERCGCVLLRVPPVRDASPLSVAVLANGDLLAIVAAFLEPRTRFVTRAGGGHLLPCLEYTPPQGGSSTIVLWLHGAGSRGAKRLDRLRLGGLPLWIDAERLRPGSDAAVSHLHPASPRFPFVVVAPQCPERTEWAADATLRALKALCLDARSRHGCTRIVAMGPSMGGLGAYMLAVKWPSLVASIVPFCGGGNTMYARRLCGGGMGDLACGEAASSGTRARSVLASPQARHADDDGVIVDEHAITPSASACPGPVPCWFWHADDDGVIACSSTAAIVDALRAGGNDRVRFTRLASGVVPTVWSAQWCRGHDVSAVALGDAALWAWVADPS